VPNFVTISSVIGGKVICVPVALPKSTSTNTPAEGTKDSTCGLNPYGSQIPGHKARKNPSDNADLGLQAVGPALRIMQLNIEGLSSAKRHIIQSLPEIHNYFFRIREEEVISIP